MEQTWHRTAAMGALLLLVGGAATGVVLPAEDPGVKHLLPFTTRDLFLEKCSRCHEPEKAYGVIRDRPAWARTVASMALRDRSWIPPEDVGTILDYQVYYRTHMRLVFQQHCGGCHAPDEITREHRSRSQWRTIITYMARRKDTDLTSEERELLIAGLSP